MAVFGHSLEPRQQLTRALCWIALIAGIMTGAALIAFALAVFLATLGAEIVVRPLVAPAFLIAAIAYSVAIVLSIWRSCDRCGYHLFSIRPVVLGHVVRDGASQPPHHLARKFLGSFQWGAIRDAAMGRGARCLWCGHKDGLKPDYVVVSQQS